MKKSLSIKTNTIWILTNLIFALVTYIFFDSNYLYKILSIIGLLQMLLSIYLYKKRGNQLFSLIIVYDVVMYLFLFGQCLMWILTENYTGRSIIEIYSKSIIIKTQIFTLSSIFLFHLASMNVTPKKIKKFDNRIILLESLKVVGYILLVISFIPEIIYNLHIFKAAYLNGYMGIYSNQVSSIFQKILNLREFFLPSVILIIVGDYKNNKAKNLKKFLILIIVIDVMIAFYVGSRSDALMQILSIILLFSTLKSNKNSKIAYVKYAVLLFILLIIVNIVRIVRIDSNKNVNSFVNAISNYSESSLIVDTIGELGGTMSTCIETMLLVPSKYEFRHGTTYIYAFTWILPNYLTNNLSAQASMNNWLDTVRYTGSGWGFSTTAEAYINFGYFGIFMFLIFGFFAGKYFKGVDSELYYNNPGEFALSFIIFSKLLIFSRIDFLSTLPSILYYYLCIKILILLMFKYIKKRSMLNEKN